MMKIKKNTALSVLCLVFLFSFFACRKNSQRYIKYSDYLYEVWVNNYDLDSLIAHFDPTSLAVGCSQMRKGKYVGRNLDWMKNRQVTLIVHTQAGNGRYASLGVASCSADFTVETMDKGMTEEMYKHLPLCVVDGINEQGVYIGVNNAPTGETSMDTTKWHHSHCGLGAYFTNPHSSKTYADFYLVRYVLDKASSVREAIELIKAINWYEHAKIPGSTKTQTLHWLIADVKETAVVEFIDNALNYVISSNTDTPSFATIMTNFSNTLKEKGIIQAHGCGYERYDILASYYSDTGYSKKDIRDVMKKVWYSQVYTEDINSDNFFLSEFEGSVSTESQKEYTVYDMYKSPTIKKDSVFVRMIKKIQAMYEDKSLWYKDDSPIWHTNHTAIYDIEKKDMTILLHEGKNEMNTTWISAKL